MVQGRLGPDSTIEYEVRWDRSVSSVTKRKQDLIPAITGGAQLGADHCGQRDGAVSP